MKSEGGDAVATNLLRGSRFMGASKSVLPTVSLLSRPELVAATRISRRLRSSRRDELHNFLFYEIDPERVSGRNSHLKAFQKFPAQLFCVISNSTN